MKLKWLLLLLVGVMMSELALASPIGYNTTDGDLHVWNNGTIEPHYYYSGNCLEQVSNKPSEQWEIVDKYLGTYIAGQYIMYKWDSSYSCSRADLTDNLTFSNNTATTLISQAGAGITLEMKSHIKTNDDLITQIFRFKSNRVTNRDIWFLLNSYNISVSGDEENDYLTMFNLSNNQTIRVDLNYLRDNGLTNYYYSSQFMPFYFIEDLETKKLVSNEWVNNSYDWFIKANGNVSLYINLGIFQRNQEKLFYKQWVDAGCRCLGIGTITSRMLYPNGTNFLVNDNFTIGCNTTQQGLGSCGVGCAIFWYSQQYTPLGTIINVTPSAEDNINCTPESSINICRNTLTTFGVAEWGTLKCRLNSSTFTYCKHEAVAGFTILSSGGNDTICLGQSIISIPQNTQLFKDKNKYPLSLVVAAMFIGALTLSNNKKRSKNE